MAHSNVSIPRRALLTGIAASGVLAPLDSFSEGKKTASLISPENISAAKLAEDESFWRDIASHYDRTQGIVNLEHGYWGKMAKSVQQAYIAATNMVNAQNSYYARKDFSADVQLATRQVAQALGAQENEIALTRNATEAIHNLVRQYRGLTSKDSVLLADIDYPSFKSLMHWLKQDKGVNSIELACPVFADQEQIKQLYIQAFDKHPNIKLMLITHVSNQHGLVVPVREIVAEANKRGIDVICDSAQSWGLLDYKIPDLDVDWAGFNLHKWIGAPVGVGALYMRNDSLDKIAPYPGDVDPDGKQVATRIHMATSNFAAILAVPAALDFHLAVGAQNKEARLRYLRNLWFSEAKIMPHVEVLGGKDDASSSGMSSFRLQGKTSLDDANMLQQTLEKKFGIFTVVRKGLSGGCCIRITPQVFTSADEIAQLVEAMKKIA